MGKNVVLGYYFKAVLQEGESGVVGALPPALTKMDVQWSERLPINKAAGFGGNLEILQSSAKSGGFFDNPYVDADGVYRRVPLVQAYRGLPVCFARPGHHPGIPEGRGHRTRGRIRRA